jgi:hypothetical protein
LAPPLATALVLRPDQRFPRKSFLLFPLRTHVPRDAKVLAQRLTFLTDIAFARRMEHGMAIGPKTMERYLQELVRFLVEAAEGTREVAPQMTAEAAAYEAACRRPPSMRCATRSI